MHGKSARRRHSERKWGFNRHSRCAQLGVESVACFQVLASEFAAVLAKGAEAAPHDMLATRRSACLVRQRRLRQQDRGSQAWRFCLVTSPEQASRPLGKAELRASFRLRKVVQYWFPIANAVPNTPVAASLPWSPTLAVPRRKQALLAAEEDRMGFTLRWWRATMVWSCALRRWGWRRCVGGQRRREVAQALPGRVGAYRRVVMDETARSPGICHFKRRPNLRRVVLKRCRPPKGRSSELLEGRRNRTRPTHGPRAAQLVRGPFGSDLGFIHLCWDIQDMKALGGGTKRRGLFNSVDQFVVV